MANKHSLFDQSLDRSVFVTYFLGGIVPLLALAVMAERWIPGLPDRDAQIGAVTMVVAIGILSLVSFLALRRIVLGAVQRMNEDNERLDGLLVVARELAEAPHAQVVSEATASWALRVTRGEAAWIVSRADAGKDFAVVEQRGEPASEWFERESSEWLELAAQAIRQSEVVRIHAEGHADLSLVVAPIGSDLDQETVLLVARSGSAFASSEVDALEALAAQSRVALTNAELQDVQRNFFSHMTDLVLAALDAHVQFRSGHAQRVAEVANRVGRAMGLSEKALHDLHFAALLHDVGMLRIPLEQQRNPQYFRTHSTLGHKMLSRIRVWQDVAPIVLQHHERMDGCGYPEGLLGDQIGLGARILAVCDGWDAMRSIDQHRPAMSVDEAIAELERNAGTQFDPDVVSAIIRLAERDDL